MSGAEAHAWVPTGKTRAYETVSRPIDACKHCGHSRHRNAPDTGYVYLVEMQGRTRTVLMLDREGDSLPCSPFVRVGT